MQDRSSFYREPPSTQPRRKTADGFFWAALAIGVAIGLSLGGIVGIGLLWFEVLQFDGEVASSDLGCMPAGELEQCVATAIVVMDCPECAPATPIPPTATPLPTETPDIAATATSACADFQSLFPGTPCP